MARIFTRACDENDSMFDSLEDYVFLFAEYAVGITQGYEV